MQWESAAENPPAAPSPHKMTLNASARIRTPQRIHAWAILLIPLFGVIGAIALTAYVGLFGFEIWLLLVSYLLTFTGITVGFHRLLTHRSFQTDPVVKATLTILGSMAAQGPPIYWVSNHRRHHQHSDQSGDPHSPHFDGERALGKWQGLWHAHTRWTYRHELTNALVFAKELLRDPLIGRINRQYYLWVALGLAIPTAIGALYTGTWTGALAGFLWGGLARLFVSYHAANSINSVTHLFGRRPFNTREQSRNTRWLVLITCGEAWHNNHHAFPSSAIFGLKWWQIDIGGLVVRVLAALRLAWGVKVPSAEVIAETQRQLLEEGRACGPSRST